MKFVIIILASLTIFLSCGAKSNYCYERHKNLKLTDVKSHLSLEDLTDLKGWYIKQRSIDGIFIDYNDSTIGKLQIIFFMKDCKFKNLNTQNIFSFSDSAIYRNQINLDLLKKAYEKLKIFSKLDVSSIAWNKGQNRILFTLEKSDNSTETKCFDLNSKAWVEW
jgi:hypothetical protein